MIRAVTVTNYLGESKRFELAFPEDPGSPFNLSADWDRAKQILTRQKSLRMTDRCITRQE